MDQDVPETYNPGQIGNRAGRRRIDFAKPIERLTNNRQLTLDTRTKQIICFVFAEGFAPGELGDELGGVPRIPYQLARVSVHRPAGAPPALGRGNTDSQGWLR